MSLDSHTDSPPPPTVLDYATPQGPSGRRKPSVALGLCAAAMPLLALGLPYLFFHVACADRPPKNVQYWTFTAVLVGQWIAYCCGILCLRLLRTTCPPPPTRAGRVITVICGGAFLGMGGLWCMGCTIVLGVITFMPG